MSCIDQRILQRDTKLFSHSFIHSFIAICKAHYVEDVESEVLEAVARWYAGRGKIKYLNAKIVISI